MYGKIWKTMFDGSLVETHWEAVITFMVMIIFADKHGVVDMTPTAMSNRTTIPKKIIIAGIETLESPDENSRSDKDDGARIRRCFDREWGWEIVNYDQYTKAMDMEAVRAHWRERYRDRKAAVIPIPKKATKKKATKKK